MNCVVGKRFRVKINIEVGFPTTHSLGQLTNHLLFWNRRKLAKFKGEPEEKFSGNNDETFNNFDTKKWKDTVKRFRPGDGRVGKPCRNR